MHLSGRAGMASARTLSWPGRLMLAALLAALAAGCASSGSAPRPGNSGTSTTIKVIACGTASTAAGVKVHVEVVKGHLACSTALAIMQSYATAVRNGLAPGNGGGGPVKVKGWTCQGFATPIVDETGNTSKCVLGGTEILEVLLP